jgi:rubrerythrin
MAEKPTYLKLLNGIACAETRAHQYLSAWAECTTDPDVRRVLLTVAAREGEHGMAFAKRINELGFELKPTEDPKFESRMKIARSNRTDLEKAESLGLLDYRVDDSEPDVFDKFFRDHSIDIKTGELLGRYIAEERDSLRLLMSCAASLKACATETGTGESARFAALEDKLDMVCRAVEELRQVVCAQTMPAASV